MPDPRFFWHSHLPKRSVFTEGGCIYSNAAHVDGTGCAFCFIRSAFGNLEGIVSGFSQSRIHCFQVACERFTSFLIAHYHKRFLKTACTCYLLTRPDWTSVKKKLHSSLGSSNLNVVILILYRCTVETYWNGVSLNLTKIINNCCRCSVCRVVVFNRVFFLSQALWTYKPTRDWQTPPHSKPHNPRHMQSNSLLVTCIVTL